jgi:hypothetical protein
VENDDFGEDIISKSYPKYKYQSVSTGPKPAKKETFLKGNLEHLYVLHPLKKSGYCFFCPKKSTEEAFKEQDSTQSSFQAIFQFNLNDLIKVPKEKESKRERFRGTRTLWWCKDCKKFICKNCWRLFH